jgi:hypothetical protein
MTDVHDSDRIDAAFADVEQARSAMAALENAGIDGNRIELQGQAGQQAHDPRGVAPDADSRAAGFAGKAVGGGVIVGAVIGAVLALAIGIPVLGGGSINGPVIALLIGATFAGAGVGIAVGGYSRVKQGEAWEETFDAPEGASATVAVRPTADDERDEITKILRDHGGQV